MSIRQKIRDFLDASDAPMWGCEIVKATGCTPQNISNMVSDGSLVKHDGEHVSSYTVGRRPPPRLTQEQRIAKRRQFDRQRDAVRKPQQRRTKAEQPKVKRVQIVLASSHATVGGESVAQFLARGGRIEKLPGLQKSNVYPQRRPMVAPGIRSYA